jgi:hypothetical protein
MQVPGGVSKRLIILLVGVGGALILVVVVRLAFGGVVGASASASDSGSWWSRAQDGVVDSRPEHLAAVARVSQSGQQQPYTGDTLRDPMMALATEASVSDDTGEIHRAAPVITLPYMSLEGIVWDAQSPIVMLDGNPLRVGEEIKGARITEIGFDRVVLTYKGKRFEMTVE